MDDPNPRDYPGEQHFYNRDKVGNTPRQSGNLLLLVDSQTEGASYG